MWQSQSSVKTVLSRMESKQKCNFNNIINNISSWCNACFSAGLGLSQFLTVSPMSCTYFCVNSEDKSTCSSLKSWRCSLIVSTLSWIFSDIRHQCVWACCPPFGWQRLVWLTTIATPVFAWTSISHLICQVRQWTILLQKTTSQVFTSWLHHTENSFTTHADLQHRFLPLIVNSSMLWKFFLAEDHFLKDITLDFHHGNKLLHTTRWILKTDIYWSSLICQQHLWLWPFAIFIALYKSSWINK